MDKSAKIALAQSIQIACVFILTFVFFFLTLFKVEAALNFSDAISVFPLSASLITITWILRISIFTLGVLQIIYVFIEKRTFLFLASGICSIFIMIPWIGTAVIALVAIALNVIGLVRDYYR